MIDLILCLIDFDFHNMTLPEKGVLPSNYPQWHKHVHTDKTETD